MVQPPDLPPKPLSPWPDIALFAMAVLIVALTGLYLMGDL